MITERLRQKVDSIWEAQHQHPFVRSIGDGTLADRTDATSTRN